MRIISTIFLISALSVAAFAKKVKFMVDMDTITINVNGVHVVGDFQDEAGMGPDWADPANIQMTQEVSDPSIYSVVVNIPAFRHYEFKFMNGIYGYEAEFVPKPSRVGYQFNDNRWIYIDSLANDTQVVKPVIFASNAPAGKHLLRFGVDMQNVTSIAPQGVHLAGDFQGWDPATTYLYSFDGNVFEYIAYVDTGIPTYEHEFKYHNGNTSASSESVPSPCTTPTGSNRGAFISSDSVLSVVCFSACGSCVNGIFENNMLSDISIFPNPSPGIFNVSSTLFRIDAMKAYNVFGELVFDGRAASDFEIKDLGIYFLKIESKGQTFSEKIVVE